MLKHSRLSRFALSVGIIGIPVAIVASQPLSAGAAATTCYSPTKFGVTQGCDNGTCSFYYHCPTGIFCMPTETGGGFGTINEVLYECPTWWGGSGTCGSCTGGILGSSAQSVVIPVQTCPPPCEPFEEG